MNDWRTNNFDLIRLAAALQVAIGHVASHFHLWPALGHVGRIISLFPGVPIFFLISGMLISRSLEQSGNLRDYFRNRCLRIFPALWVCLPVTVIATVLLIPDRIGSASSVQWTLWWAAQMSVGQFWRPQYFLSLGTHALNGSLWTIAAELQFYLVLPLLYFACRLRQRSGNAALACILLCGVAFYVALNTRPQWFPPWNSFVLVAFAVLPYLWIFLLGVLIQRNFARVRHLLAGKLLWWIVAYAIVTWLAHGAGLTVTGNFLNPLSLLILAGVVFSAAFTAPQLAERILRRNDLSYGLYIYHAPLLNLLLALGVTPAFMALPACVGISLLIAAGSWWLVEKPFLRRKRHALREIGVPGELPAAPQQQPPAVCPPAGLSPGEPH